MSLCPDLCSLHSLLHGAVSVPCFVIARSCAVHLLFGDIQAELAEVTSDSGSQFRAIYLHDGTGFRVSYISFVRN